MTTFDRPMPLTSSAQELAHCAGDVSHLYAFLARVFCEEISIDLLRSLRSPRLRNEFRAGGIDLDEHFLAADEETLIEALAVEYAGLFLGPGGHVNTHESVQAEKDGYLWGDRTVAVRHFIENAGVSYRDNFRGIPDHISVELEFMAVLTRFEAAEWNAGNAERAANCLEYQREFLAMHLGAWCGKFCAQVVERAGMPLYRQMATLLADLVASESEDVMQRLDYAREAYLPQSQPDAAGHGSRAGTAATACPAN